MAIKQTRRSISVRGTTYDKLRVYGEAHGRSMSDVVEELLATILDQTPALEPAPQPKPPVVVEKSASRLRFNPPPIIREKRPALANRVVRAVPPAPSKPSLPGRPAPTPVKIADTTHEKDDYRAIRF